ncbi:Type I phosphodiesterase / nucleotide pyrophosphatase [Cryobacterium flavum]|uniref:Phosphodiesterase n=1 Tax=Cryobacterium flavum TaxID=1424659 RepID=A0A4R8VJQ4_9MICO|nr:alkaline phosphatase family protein [Cryobacterium flavum]TFB82377.1 phosphodiesterase [Cryobacterium flavum]SDO49477.1 Type I phosphodiesterase / nucleotide pyrophosphatase [Cryobacterium flavum]
MSRRKFCLIGIDGLILDRALRSEAAPNLSAFIERGRLAAMTMDVPTISGPGWSSILTGATHAEHNVFDNTFHGHTLRANADLLSRAYFADQSVTSYVASGWPPLADPAGPGPVISPRLDQQNAGVHKVIVRDGEMYGYRRADSEVADISRLYLSQGGPDASFVYLGEVDEAGHVYGGASAEYLVAVTRVDEHLGTLLHAIATRAAREDEDWLVGITTDHGHLDEGGHGGGEDVVRSSFFAVARSVGGGTDTSTGAEPRPAEAWSAEGVSLPESMRPDQIAAYLLEHLA